MKQLEAALLATLLISSLALKAQVESSLEKQIDSVFAEYNDLQKPGAAVAVVKDGKIVFKKGYGSANLEYNIPVTSSTIFHIASVSKQFTAFCILLLADQGKLSLDDDIRKHIPEVPDFGKTITLRHLASHTSGMRDQWNLLMLAGWRLDDVITKDHILKMVSNQKELNFEPGEEYLYCNTGFTLLAEVVARVSGKSFAEFTEENIFKPLGMQNTLFYDDHEKIVPNRSYSYYRTPSGYKKRVLSYANVGATSLFTTVEDLCLWAMNFESPKIGNENIFKQMNTPATLNNGKTFGGALGQFIDIYKGLNQIQHGGADAGYRSYLGRFPDQHFAVAVFSNYAGASTGGLALGVAELFLKDEIKTPVATVTSNSKFIKLNQKQLKAFEANYWNEAGSYSRKIYVKNDTLRYNRGGDNESALAPIGKNEFQMLNVPADLKVSFTVSGNKKIMTVVVDGGDPVQSEEYKEVNYSSKDLEAFAGSYYSEEIETTYHLIVEKDRLVVKHQRHSDITISPIMDDLFASNNFLGLIKFERSQNKVTGMRVSNGRVRSLYFKKQ